MRDPLAIEVRRGRLVESHHRVHAVIADADGRVLESWGDPDRPVFPRSTVKPMQALPLIETGAADRFELSNGLCQVNCAPGPSSNLTLCPSVSRRTPAVTTC